MGVPDDAVGHLDKFSRALRRAKLEKAGRDASLHSFFNAKPAAKGGRVRVSRVGVGGSSKRQCYPGINFAKVNVIQH